MFFVPPYTFYPSLYFEHSLPLSLSLSFTPLLTNLHILPFSCNVMHNLPFPFSSLSHLHPLVSFVGKSIPSIPSPICPCISNLARFYGSFNLVIHLLPPSSLRFLAVGAENPLQSLPRTIILRFSWLIPRLVALISIQLRFSISNSAHRRTVS